MTARCQRCGHPTNSHVGYENAGNDYQFFPTEQFHHGAPICGKCERCLCYECGYFGDH